MQFRTEPVCSKVVSSEPVSTSQTFACMSALPDTSNFESQDTSRCQTAPLWTSYVPTRVPSSQPQRRSPVLRGGKNQVAVPVVDDAGDGALVALEEDGAHLASRRLASGAASSDDSWAKSTGERAT